MDQIPHDSERVHIIEPPLQHHNNIPAPRFEDDRRGSFSSDKDLVILEGYIILKEPASRGQKATWALSKRVQWKLKHDEMKDIVKKQQKRGVSVYIPLEARTEIKQNKRAQVDRLLHDRTNDRFNDDRTKYELAALKTEGFQTRSGAMDEKLKVIIRRRVRPGIPYDRSSPITAPPPVATSEIIDLTQSEDYERSSQDSYPTPSPQMAGHGGFPFPAQNLPVHHGGQPGPQIFGDRFSPQPFDSPIGEEQRRPQPQRQHPIIEQHSDHFGSFGSPSHITKEDKSKGVQQKRHDETESSSASENDVWSLNSDATPLTTISSGRSSYGGEKRNFPETLHRKASVHEHHDNKHDFKEERTSRKETQRPGPSGQGHENSGRGSKAEKSYHSTGSKPGSSGHEREDYGGNSTRNRDHHADGHHRRSSSLDRDDPGRHDHKAKQHHYESRRNSRSRDRSERSYEAERPYRPDSHSRSSHSHGHGVRQSATREHVRKAPLVRSRGSLSDGSSVYTDDEYVVVPQRSSRRHHVHAAPRSIYEEAPLRLRPVYDEEDSFDYAPSPLGRSSTNYRPKIANKAFRPVDLHDSRFDYAREQAELQRQRVLDMASEKEDRIIEQQVQEALAREDEEMMLQHQQRRSELAREESRRRIAIKVREELDRARLSRERPFEAYQASLLGLRASTAFRY